MSQSFLVAIVLLSLPVAGSAKTRKDPCVLRASQVKHRVKQPAVKQPEKLSAERTHVASERSSVPFHAGRAAHADRAASASKPRAHSSSVHAQFFTRHPGIPFYTDVPIYSSAPHRKAKHIQGTAASAKATGQIRKNAKSAAHNPKTGAQHKVASEGEHKGNNPAYANSYPQGAKAQCFDTTYSMSGSCAGHGGVFWVIPQK